MGLVLPPQGELLQEVLFCNRAGAQHRHCQPKVPTDSGSQGPGLQGQQDFL